MDDLLHLFQHEVSRAEDGQTYMAVIHRIVHDPTPYRCTKVSVLFVVNGKHKFWSLKPNSYEKNLLGW